jgi:hypothetical protein
VFSEKFVLFIPINIKVKKEKSFLDSVSDSLLLRLPLAVSLAAQFFPGLQQDICDRALQ